MGEIKEKLKKHKILISDGAWGTFLHSLGLQAGECPELWNLTHPDKVFIIAKSYIEAGSDIIETNSFGANKFKLQNFGLVDKVEEINIAAAQISRTAAGNDKIVIGSVGPTGKMLFMGEINEEDLFDAYRCQISALISGGVDAIVIETMTDIEEAIIAIKAAKTITDKEVICTMTFEKNVDGKYRTIMGVTPSEMVIRTLDAGVDIVGANCGNGIEDMISIVKEIREINKEIPVLVHANAGIPIYSDGKTLFPETPEFMASKLIDLVDAGANIIGGCCGTNPEHIRAFREKLFQILK